MAAYRACLFAAGYGLGGQKIQFKGNKELNDLAGGIDPANGLTGSQAITWFSPSRGGGESPLLGATESFEHVEELEREIIELHKKYRNAVGVVLREIEGWVWDDPVSAMYSSVFSDNVIVDPAFDESELAKEWGFE